jgi:phosphoserine phosphatase
MISMAEPVWLFDLDGTVIDVNSFPLWVREILLGRFPQLSIGKRLVIGARCAIAIILRKLLRQSHMGFKRTLQRIWADLSAALPADQAADPFVERLLAHVRPRLRVLLDEVAAGRIDAVLTTAAAAEYALPLARRLGFRHAIATPAGGGADAADNVGETKRDRTLAYLAAQGWAGRPRLFLSDHRDDLPLIRECAGLVWFGAEEGSAELFHALVGVEAIGAGSLPPDATAARIAEQLGRSVRTCT